MVISIVANLYLTGTCDQIPPTNTPVTGNVKDCLELPPTNFSIFTLKNVTWRTYMVSFTVQDCFLFRFVCIELVSLIRFLQIWVAIHVYGTMIYWFTLIKKLIQTSIVIVSGSIINASTVHLNGIWHLIWRYISKPVLGGHPVLSGHYSIPLGFPLNTGFTVCITVFLHTNNCLPPYIMKWIVVSWKNTVGTIGLPRLAQ